VNKYLKNYLISIQDNFNYRIDFLIRLVTGFLFSYAIVAMWYVITDVNSGQLDAITIANTIKYMILASLFNEMLNSISGGDITQKVQTGDISRQLLYPVSFPATLFFQCLGKATATLITRSIPTLLILTLIYQPAWNLHPVNLLILLITGLAGFYISFMVVIWVDMISFWWVETFYFQMIRGSIIGFFSGGLVPLWFYPDWLLKVMEFLPFKYIIYVPIAAYLGHIRLDELPRYLLIYFVWICLTTAVTYMIWQAGKKKVCIHGG
jgi:ABC-2 type transport system permease protein